MVSVGLQLSLLYLGRRYQQGRSEVTNLPVNLSRYGVSSSPVLLNTTIKFYLENFMESH